MIHVFTIAVCIYAALLWFYRVQWQQVGERQQKIEMKRTSISVVIAARNEEKNIGNLLIALRSQTYPASEFEVIIVDDHSSDNTAAIIQSFATSNVRLIQLQGNPEGSSKKQAIATAIENANNELIVATDADCIPSTTWLEKINECYLSEQADFIAAPVKFSHDHSLLQIFQSLDFLILQGITAASVHANFHMMCNGANLAYKKSIFEKVNGFEGIDRQASGDDMLLMHKINKLQDSIIVFLKSKEAIVVTEPMKTWKDFFNQRRRWASKTFLYDDFKIIAVLGFVYLFNLLFFVILINAFFEPKYWLLALLYLVGKTLVELPFVISVSRFYNETRLLRYFFFFQPVHIFYTVIVGITSQFGKYEWKGRRSK